MSRSGPKVLKDIRELRALAHPIRTALLNELSSRAEANVTELAGAVGEPVNTTSFHLRQLAKYDFIEEAPGGARDGRGRWWRLAYEDGIDWEGLAATSPEAGQVVRTELSSKLESTLTSVRSYFARSADELPVLQRGAFWHDWYMQLTASEAEQFDQEYLELCLRWRDKTQVSEQADDERARFGIFIYGFPIEEQP